MPGALVPGEIIRKLRCKIWKNEPEENFIFINTLSMGNRKLSKLLENVNKSITPVEFNKRAKKYIDMESLFSEYDVDKVYCTDHIEHYNNHREDIRKRYLKIKQTINGFA